jgi:replication factor C subunit 3/5
VEKYRPQNMDQVVAHKDIVETSAWQPRCRRCVVHSCFPAALSVSRLTKEDRLPHLLLHGPPGTGKTSTILALARQLYGQSYKNMTLELNASDERGIDVVRSQISDFASTKRIFSSGFKLIVLDECDAMTKDAQFALRRVIEKYTRNTRFCLICNYVSKIIPALQSRCTRFRFAPLPRECVLDRLREVATAEGLDVSEEGLTAVQVLSGGDMRRCLNILQSTSMASPRVDADAVYSCTGQPRPSDVEAVAHTLLNSPFSVALHALRLLQTERGLALADLVRALLPWVVRLRLDAQHKAALVEALADAEARLAYVTHERVQQAAVVGAFAVARLAIVQAAVA